MLIINKSKDRMEKQEQLQKVINGIIVDKHMSDHDDIDHLEKSDLKLEDDLGLDSLDRVELCMEIEKNYNITINDSLVEEWGGMTVKQISEQIVHLI